MSSMIVALPRIRGSAPEGAWFQHLLLSSSYSYFQHLASALIHFEAEPVAISSKLRCSVGMALRRLEDLSSAVAAGSWRLNHYAHEL